MPNERIYLLDTKAAFVYTIVLLLIKKGGKLTVYVSWYIIAIVK